MARTVKLGVLENVRIASPCTARWEEMAGDERVRHCGICRKDVFNLSAMGRAEAEALVGRAGGPVCARLYRRADGTVMTADCPVGLRAVRERAARLAMRVAAAAVVLVGSGVSWALRASGAEPVRARAVRPLATLCEWLSPTPTPQAVMGEIALGKIGPAPAMAGE